MSGQRQAMRSNNAPAGSTTLTATSSPAQSNRPSASASSNPRLVLRAASGNLSQNDTSSESSRKVQWAKDVVNNEGMGRKSSKICCIYHKPRAVGESSDESSSDSSSDSDSGDDGTARLAGGKKSKQHKHRHHAHDDHGPDCKGAGGGKDLIKDDSKKAKNAYEHVPKT